VDTAKSEIARQMQSMEKPKTGVDSPISVAVDLELLRRSGKPEERQLADVLAAVAELSAGLANVSKRLGEPSTLLPPAYVRDILSHEFRPLLMDMREMTIRARVPPAMVEDLMMTLARASALVEQDRKEEAREFLHRTEKALRSFFLESGYHPGFIDDVLEGRRRKKPQG